MDASSPQAYDHVSFQLFALSPSVDPKANGRMLPQNQSCPYCPAKYSRPTHLHRHIRSHTHKRVHKCTMCDSQFVRRDVLNRHMKTCGGSLAANRSKRKACQSCVQSRVKCDRHLQDPCSRCITRGKKCIFISDTTGGRENDITHAFDSSGTLSSSSSSPPACSPFFSVSEDTSNASSPSSLDTPPDWDLDDILGLPISQNEETNNECGWEAFLDKLYSPSYDSSCAIALRNDYSDLDFLLNFVPTSFEYDNTDSTLFLGPPPIADPTSVDLDVDKRRYLCLFFTDFCKQFPLMHQATWNIEGKPPVLVRAMQACGALFVKTRQAAEFIEETLDSRNLLLQEFASCSPKDRVFVILAVVLLQTLGLFHQRPETRVASSVYHGMLVMMIHQSGLIAQERSWVVPNIEDDLSLEQSWMEWASHETAKRALLLSYLHDCCYSIYFSKQSSFRTTEFDIHLPCDEELWNAQNPVEWLSVLQAASLCGVDSTMLRGTGFQQALTHLTEAPRIPFSIDDPCPSPLNSFSLSILIHVILRDVLSRCAPSDRTLYSLHNWFQLWIQTPVPARLGQESPLIQNPLPYYWLVQVLLVAIDEGGPEWVADTSRSGKRYPLLKEWLERIRFFLRQSHDIPVRLWGELMVVRSCQALEVEFDDLSNREAGLDQPNGLLSFFAIQ
ncbi:fungal-specific transcription factor domain-containing protein [Desarmillaria tabescens]|uniref:Fungal-specific transcription factor domain-containing protein n=1 Tax=Armillaria tabescens TaxID=1929756 RepID=A0AA39KB89_ARMTA|nr:fungal-specific transcription factor domain-containing protein [Desarmillaria tabescens]KAK0455638.1 fungal-specific transcription factor domain-containing protein [Desarmillaria tabescens]